MFIMYFALHQVPYNEILKENEVKPTACLNICSNVKIQCIIYMIFFSFTSSSFGIHLSKSTARPLFILFFCGPSSSASASLTLFLLVFLILNYNLFLINRKKVLLIIPRLNHARNAAML